MNREDLISSLQQANPWWEKYLPAKELGPDPYSRELWDRFYSLAQKGNLLITGPRLAGKSHTIRHLVGRFLVGGMPGQNLCYCDLSIPALRGVKLLEIVQTWLQSVSTLGEAPRRLFLDGVDYHADWQRQLGDLTETGYRFVGTAQTEVCPDSSDSPEGKQPFGCQTMQLQRLTFADYLKVTSRLEKLTEEIGDLKQLFFPKYYHPKNYHSPLPEWVQGAFHDYLARGIYPGPALAPDVASGQLMIEQDLIARTLREDLPARYQARQAAEVEPLMTHLASREDTVIDLPEAARELGVKGRQSVDNRAELLLKSGLYQRVLPLGYHSTVRRGRDKLLGAHPAIVLSHLRAGGKFHGNQRLLGPALESAIHLHLLNYFGPALTSIHYHREAGLKKPGADLVVETAEGIVPICLMQGNSRTRANRMRCFIRLLERQKMIGAMVITPTFEDCERIFAERIDTGQCALMPAALACLTLSNLNATRQKIHGLNG